MQREGNNIPLDRYTVMTKSHPMMRNSFPVMMNVTWRMKTAQSHHTALVVETTHLTYGVMEMTSAAISGSTSSVLDSLQRLSHQENGFAMVINIMQSRHCEKKIKYNPIFIFCMFYRMPKEKKGRNK